MKLELAGADDADECVRILEEWEVALEEMLQSLVTSEVLLIVLAARRVASAVSRWSYRPAHRRSGSRPHRDAVTCSEI